MFRRVSALSCFRYQRHSLDDDDAYDHDDNQDDDQDDDFYRHQNAFFQSKPVQRRGTGEEAGERAGIAEVRQRITMIQVCNTFD